jgi:TPR repeat protein
MAAFNLGWINARGLLSPEGLMQDLDVAKDWFEKSAKLGFKDAVDILEKNF